MVNYEVEGLTGKDGKVLITPLFLITFCAFANSKLHGYIKLV